MEIVMKKELAVHQPIISFVPQNNFIFSILTENTPCFNQYIFENYIQTCCFYHPEWNALVSRFDDDYNRSVLKNKCLQGLFIPKAAFSLLMPNMIDYIINAIDLGFYISLNINMFYIAEYRIKHHLPHEVMIYGYCTEDKIFYIRDFFQDTYRNGCCTFDELNHAVEHYDSANIHYPYAGLLGIKPNDQQHISIDLMQFCTQLHAWLNGVLNIKSVSYGVSWFDALTFLLENDGNNIEISSFIMSIYFISQHILLMIKRTELLAGIFPKEAFILITDSLRQLQKKVQLTKNKCIKLSFDKTKHTFNENERASLIQSLKVFKSIYAENIYKIAETIAAMPYSTEHYLYI